MKGCKLTLFLFIIWCSIISASIDDNLALALQSTHQEFETIIKEIDLNADKLVINTIEDNLVLKPQTTYQGTTFQGIDLNAEEDVINMTSDTVNYSQDFFYAEDLHKICHGQVNEFIWKCPTINENEEKYLKFRTIDDEINSPFLTWYLKSINNINIFEMDSMPRKHQIQFYVIINKNKIQLSRLYPSYPEISGFEILQFISNLAFECKFSIEVFDVSDISTVYFALYGNNYYEYHFEGINLNQKFLFKQIVIKEHKFLDCLNPSIKGIMKKLSELFYENIQLCESEFMPVEFCPITFDTHYIFYEKIFRVCIDWSPIGEFPVIDPPFLQRFEITLEDITRIMKKKKQSNVVNFIKINWALDEKIIKTYDNIKTQIFDTSFLMKLFSKIFELCFFELKKQKSNPNPEDILKLYLRPCVLPNMNLFLKYYTDV